MYIPTYQDMLEAHERIKPHIRRTPIRTSDYLNDLTGAQIFFKCENFQEPGAFKVRGATNAVFGLDEAQAAKGVAAMLKETMRAAPPAAMLRGIPCSVVMPHRARRPRRTRFAATAARSPNANPRPVRERRHSPGCRPKRAAISSSTTTRA